MKHDAAWGKIENMLNTMEEEEKAKLAAFILNETNPTKDCMKAFFDTLDDTVHGELVNRAAEQEGR